MECIGEEGQRAREEAADALDDRVAEHEAEHEREPAAGRIACHRAMVVGVAVFVVVTCVVVTCVVVEVSIAHRSSALAIRSTTSWRIGRDVAKLTRAKAPKSRPKARPSESATRPRSRK